MTAILGVVTGTVVEVCRYCGRPVARVEVRSRDATWSQPVEHHACVKTALADLVDAEAFGTDEHEEGGFGA